MTAQHCMSSPFATHGRTHGLARIRSYTKPGVCHIQRAKLQCVCATADASGTPDDKQSVARSTGERAIGLWQSFVTLVRNPAASQKLEKSWRIARRNREQHFKRLWAAFCVLNLPGLSALSALTPLAVSFFYQPVLARLQRNIMESQIGKLLHSIWGLVMVAVFPFQILALTIHVQLYKLSVVYNSYCLEEAERAWRWGNIYEKETQAWKAGFKLLKAVLLWSIYFAITPATMVWMMPPVLMSAIMADRWRDLPRTGSFVAVVLFWFLKFPLGTPIQWL